MIKAANDNSHNVQHTSNNNKNQLLHLPKISFPSASLRPSHCWPFVPEIPVAYGWSVPSFRMISCAPRYGHGGYRHFPGLRIPRWPCREQKTKKKNNEPLLRDSYEPFRPRKKLHEKTQFVAESSLPMPTNTYQSLCCIIGM